MNRINVATMLLSLTVLAALPADAHMPWLATNADRHAELWFGETPDSRTYHMPEKVASIQLLADGTETAIATSQVDEDELIGLRSKAALRSDAEISGTVTYGLYHGMKLTYHVEHLPSRDATTWPTEPRNAAALQTVITPSPAGGVMVSVLQNGKPLPDVDVKLFCDEGHEEDSQTTDPAGMVTFGKDVVEDGLNAVMVGVTDSSATGELEGETYTSAADYLTATFYHGDKKASKNAKKPAVSVDPNSDVSINASGLPDLPEELTSFGAAITGGTLYVYGGHTGSAHSYSVEEQSNRFRCLDLTDSSDTEWRDLPGGPRLQGLALVAHNNNLIRIGGFTAVNDSGEEHDLRSQASVAKYDPKTESWTDLPSLPQPRSSLDAAVLGDRVYVFGGWQLAGSSDDAVWHDTALSLDLSDPNAAWQQVASPTFQRRAISVAAHDGKLYVIGGMQAVGGPTTRVDVYDPANDGWVQGPSIPGSGMSGFGASAFSVGGTLYVSTLDGFVHALNDASHGWQTVAKSDPARFFHRMLPSSSKELLIVGGANMEIGKFTEIDAIRLPANP